MSYLKLEVFESKQQIHPIKLFVYKAISNEQISSIQRFMRSVCWKIYNRTGIAAFTDDDKIYTMSAVKNLNLDNSLELQFEKYEIAEIFNHKKIYADIVDYFIKKKLKGIKFIKDAKEYSKYKVKKNITTAVIYEIGGVLSSKDKQFRLRRNFNYSVKITDENKVQFWFNVKSEFETSKNVYNLITENKNVNGLKVKNCWVDFGECGVITGVGPESVVDELPKFMPLKSYMEKTNRMDKIRNCPDKSPVVRVKRNNDKEILYYYPQALHPVVTIEDIASEDPAYSKTVEKYTKLDMQARQTLAKEFVKEIEIVASPLGEISFNFDYIASSKIGYEQKSLPSPKLIFGNKRIYDYNRQSSVFVNGFYKQPDKTVKFAYYYPKGTEGLMRNFSICLTDFLKKGSLFGNSKYVIPNLMNCEIIAAHKQEYNLGDIIGYKKHVREVPEEKFDVAVVIVPTDEDASNPYSTFKTAWAKKNIPSQMISIKTAQLFADKDKNAVWFMHNIVLGILAKSGGIPWVVKDVQGETDCFVGIDVATLEKGIHYPACAVVFDKKGRPISFYKPKKAQKGEKINEEILQEIFDEVILGYEEKNDCRIKNLVIHRDGFSNEDAVWYQKYFDNKGISYSVVEVKKYVSSKILIDENGIAHNPKCGDALISHDEAFLVTTDIKDGKSSPRPLHIKKRAGNLSMEVILKQIYALSCMNIGAIKKSRLPVTTYYADKICKNIDYVPEGKFVNKLFFL